MRPCGKPGRSGQTSAEWRRELIATSLEGDTGAAGHTTRIVIDVTDPNEP